MGNPISRKIVLSDSINEESTLAIINQLNDINEYDINNNKKLKPIELYINTNGGSVVDGLAIIAAIEMSRSPVYTIGMGSVMSMGLIVLVSGHKRYAHKLTQFMHHEILYDTGQQSLKTHIREAKETSDLEKVRVDYLLNKTDMKIQTIKKYANLNKDWNFGTKKALKMNVIDDIIEVNADLMSMRKN